MSDPRLLLIGCGAFGRVHLAALRRLGVAAMAFDADGAVAAATGLPVAASIEAGLDACDAAIVVTPVPTHVPVATAVLLAGRDLFLEKPATETAAEAAALAEPGRGRWAASRRSGCISASTRRRSRCAAWWRTGEFGALHYLAARFSGVKRARGDSGALLNDAVHFADLLPWIAGQAPDRVFATLSDPLRARARGSGGDPDDVSLRA